MTQPAPKACTVRVRRAAALENCGTVLPKSGDCPNKSNHLHPMVTGFCNSGWHEGQKIDKPTCRFWLLCPCDCHTQLSRMAFLTDTVRMLVDNSTYVPDRGGFVMVTRAELAVQTAVSRVESARVEPSAAPGLVPDSILRDFAATETGRAAKGQLESWVREVTDAWALDPSENCTPQLVSRAIARQQGLEKPPSVGAIDAVFKRWSAIDFAVIGTRPTRFVRYTVAGIQYGLEGLKARKR